MQPRVTTRARRAMASDSAVGGVRDSVNGVFDAEERCGVVPSCVRFEWARAERAIRRPRR